MFAPQFPGRTSGFPFKFRFILPILFAIAVAACSPPEETPDFGALMRAQGPSVVNIVSLRQPGAVDESFSLSGGDIPMHPRMSTVDELGSGIIIEADGLIVTNAHLVADATSITVRLADGKREYPARLRGVDPESDIAVLRIDAHDLPVATFGDSRVLSPGDWVAAIGSPFGFTNTITAGIVGATGRSFADTGRVPFIQSDVAVNPGSSGGPLLNRRGEVVGINSMIFSPNGGYLGLSFAIPIELALDIARRLERDGQVRRGRIGITLQPLSPGLARAFGIDVKGIVVSDVEAGGPAATAGLQAGDVIIDFGGETTLAEDLLQRVATAEPGSEQRVTVWRERQLKQFVVTIGESRTRKRFPSLGRQTAERPKDEPELVLTALSPELSGHLGIGFGLRVDRAPPAEGGDAIRYGDIIVMVGSQSFSDRNEFDRLLHESGGGYAPLLVRRGMAVVYVALKVPERRRGTG